MNAIIADFLFKVGVMIAGYFFVCASISYGIDYYFKVKDKRENKLPNDIEGDE